RAHPAPSQPAVALHRLIRVLRTRRVVATRGREDLGERHLVAANQAEQDPCHRFSFESLSAAWLASSLRSANDTSSAAGRAIRTTSYRIPSPASGESGPRMVTLASSRTRRRARLRSTEVLTARLTVTPTRFCSFELGTANANRARPLYTRLPPITAWNSPCRRSR